MDKRPLCTVLFVLKWVFFIKSGFVEGEVTLSVRFSHYNNPSGDAANGHCCDGRSILCQRDGCDYIFKICLDAADSANTTTGCGYGFKESRRIKNEDDIIFDLLIGDLDNPMLFPIRSEMPRDLVVKVDVYDKDVPYTDNDFVDFLRIPVPHQTGVQTFLGRGTRSRDKTSLTGEFEVICDGDCGYFDTTTTTRRPTTTTNPGVVFIDRLACTHLSPIPANADCDNLARNGYRYQDGVYSLRVGHFDPFDAYCDMSAEGWTVIQRRVDGSTNFFRNRHDYIRGFGDIGAQTEYWLGLEKMYWLTNQRKYKLRITLQKANGGFVFAEYEEFRIDENYVLYVDGYSGTAGDALDYPGFGGMRRHNGMPFSTFDQDNDQWQYDNCGQVYESGWWFNDCYWANLNGMYRPVVNGWPFCENGQCISWRTIEGYEDFSLIRTEMEILPTREESNSYNIHGR